MNDIELKTLLGLKIKHYRNQLKLTQEELGKKINRTQRQVSLIELGESFPSPQTLINIASAFNCSMRDFLILIQSKQALAIIPVFKVEVDMSEYAQVHDKKSLKKKKKEEQKIAKTNAKREKQGLPPINEDQDIYQEASIEWVPSGSYYLIRYERDDVKAWGAIKG